jgi:hypothetical protein
MAEDAEDAKDADGADGAEVLAEAEDVVDEAAYRLLLCEVAASAARTQLLAEEASWRALSGQLSPDERALLERIHAGYVQLAQMLKEGLPDG